MQATMQAIPGTRAAMEVMAGRADEAGQIQPGLEQIFVEHKELVFLAAYRITGNASDAEDVLQTVFLRLLRQERPPEIQFAKAYMHRAAVHAALDQLRRRKETQSLALEEEANLPEMASPGGGHEPGELEDWLRHALALLNPKWAEMFALRFVEGHSNREIARMMNTSAAIVAVTLHRARTQLQKEFKAPRPAAKSRAAKSTQAKITTSSEFTSGGRR